MCMSSFVLFDTQKMCRSICDVAGQETGDYSIELATLWGPHILSLLRTNHLIKLFVNRIPLIVWLEYIYSYP